MSGYFKATHHPWPCLLFVGPLVVLYEGGILMLGGSRPELLRNGADHWFRCALEGVGIPAFWWVPPLVLLLGLFLWVWYSWEKRPRDLSNILSGVGLESVLFALGLWIISRGLLPILARLSVGSDDQPLRHLLPLIGAGIYEEAMFRLVLFTLLLGALSWVGLPGWLSCSLAVILSAAMFSAAHHMGPYGQPYHDKLFFFRLVAGGYFALLFYLRGFAIAVGAHSLYNVMITVGV
jgi:hypothetical protein